MFHDWSDERFYAWFAGYFDGEGCIYLPPKGTGVEMSVASINREVILGIQSRLGFGIVNEVHFNAERWNTKYHLRIRNYDEAESLLLKMLDNMTIKRPKADEALDRIRNSAWRKSRERSAEVLRLFHEGMNHREIARQFGMSHQNVGRICRGEATLATPNAGGARYLVHTENCTDKHARTPHDLSTSSVAVAGESRGHGPRRRTSTKATD